MAYTFDGPNKRIILSTGTTLVPVLDLYSRWKDWIALSDNSKYLPAMRSVGGDPTVSGQYLGATFFMLNGWKIRPQETSHTLTVDGNLYSEDGSSPFVPTLGTYQVLILQKVTNLIDQVAISGSTITPTEVALAVRSELTPELSKVNTNLTPQQKLMLEEMFKLLGLDPTAPLVVSETQRSAGVGISQSIATVGSTTTVTRL